MRSDRGCPLDTGVVRLMWHADGMTGEERLGAGGAGGAVPTPSTFSAVAGSVSRHHLPTVGRPAPLFLPGRFADPVLAPSALADSMPHVNKAGGARPCPETKDRRDVGVLSGGEGYPVPTMADPEPSRSELRSRAERAQARSRTLRETGRRVSRGGCPGRGDFARVHEASPSRAGRWLPGPGSMPSGPGSSRPGSRPRRCACAGLGGLRVVGLREPPRPRSRGAWPLPCQRSPGIAATCGGGPSRLMS